MIYEKICDTCKKFYKGRGKQFCSIKCLTNNKEIIKKQIISRGSQLGKLNPNWKGENASYSVKHIWLKNNFGNPKTCEQCGKNGKYISYIRNNKQGKQWTIEWSLKHGFNYEHKRKNFWGLCVNCHRKYDKEK